GIRDFHVTGVQTCALPIILVGLLSSTNLLTTQSFTLYFNVLAQSRRSFVKPSMGTPIIGSDSNMSPTTCRTLIAAMLRSSNFSFVYGSAWYCSTASSNKVLLVVDC